MPKGEERGKEAENVLEEIIAEDFPNLGKETDIGSRKQRVPSRHIIIKMPKIKDKEKIFILSSNKGRATSYIQENPHKTIS